MKTRLKPGQVWLSSIGNVARINKVCGHGVTYTIVGETFFEGDLMSDIGAFTLLANRPANRTQFQFRDHYDELLVAA